MAAGAVIGAYGWQTQLMYEAMLAQSHFATFTSLPLVFFYQPDLAAIAYAQGLLALGVVETIALGALVWAVSRLATREAAFVSGVVAAVLALTAVFARASNVDAYLYVGLAQWGLAAYAPPAVPLGGDLAPINRIWGVPMFPSLYGPLFLGLVRAVTELGPTLAWKLALLKVLGAADVAACAFLLRTLGASRAVVVAVVCNPAMYGAYVAEAHNDLVAIDFALTGAVLAKRGRFLWPSIALACVGLLKATVILPALAALVYLPDGRRRVAAAALAGALTLAGYAAFAPRYVAIIRVSTQLYKHTYGAVELAAQVAAAGVAVVAIVLAVFRRASPAPAAWTFGSLAQFPLPQYLIWGLPCAASNEGVAQAFLVSLPYAAAMLEPNYPATPFFVALQAATVLGLAAANVAAYRPAKA